MQKIQDISIYEQGTKEQKANKPEIAGVCDYFLKDNILKEGMERLLKISCELKMKPCWISKNAYKCSYKGKGVASYSIKGNDNIVISVTLAEKEDLEKVILAQSDDLITEFLNRKATHCRICSASSCSFGVSLEISGQKHHFCSRFNYMCRNPTAEQFKMIERFIEIRKDYIDSSKRESSK